MTRRACSSLARRWMLPAVPMATLPVSRVPSVSLSLASTEIRMLVSSFVETPSLVAIGIELTLLTVTKTVPTLELAPSLSCTV